MVLNVTPTLIIASSTFLFTCVISPLVIVTLYIRGKFGTSEQNQAVMQKAIEADKLEVMGVFKMALSDEARQREKRFSEIQKDVQSNRHRLNNVEQKVNYLIDKKDRRGK